MKKNWIRPQVIVEQFEANEYVSTCYSLYCAIPGDSPTAIHDGITTRAFDYSVSWDGTNLRNDSGMWHGEPCAEHTSWDPDTDTYYESGKPYTLVADVELGSATLDGGYYVTWTSRLGGALYRHYGYAYPSDSSRPNHS